MPGVRGGRGFVDAELLSVPTFFDVPPVLRFRLPGHGHGSCRAGHPWGFFFYPTIEGVPDSRFRGQEAEKNGKTPTEGALCTTEVSGSAVKDRHLRRDRCLRSLSRVVSREI